MTGKTEAFQAFGVTLRNARWSWSGRTEDGKTVVLQVWDDEIDFSAKPLKFSDFVGGEQDPEWIDRIGNRFRIQDIQWAIAHCDKKFRIVVARPHNYSASVRKTISAEARFDIIMKVEKFNDRTGEIAAIQIAD